MNNIKTYTRYDKIRQFKDVISKIKRTQCDGDALDFLGTVKLHGTNASITYDNSTAQISVGLRNSKSDENTKKTYGLYEWSKTNVVNTALKSKLKSYCLLNNINKVTLFGEWAGQGIQKKVAISKLPKAFYVVSILEGDNDYYESHTQLKTIQSQGDIKFHNILDFKTYKVSINKACPELSVELLNSIALSIDKECPVSKQLGVIGIGEGVVFRYNNLAFKVKGDNHSESKGSKKMATIDPIKAKNTIDLLNKVLTEDRLEQGYNLLDDKNVGRLIGWVVKDIIQEEGDALIFNNIDKKALSQAVALATKKWFSNKK